MGKIFHICASRGENAYSELDLPATNYELLDLADRLGLKDGETPYLEILEYRGFDYLADRIAGPPDIGQLNALAQRLSGLEGQDAASFEGFVGLEIQKSKTPIPLTRLIDFAHSGECCHVVGDAVTDEELGQFLAENGFVSEVEDLPDTAFKLLNFVKIGREHREANGGVFTSYGYVEPHSDPHPVSEAMDFRIGKPPYTILLNVSPFPDPSNPGAEQQIVSIRLPTPDSQMREIPASLGEASWKGVMAAVLDCPVPAMNGRLCLEEEIPLAAEWSRKLQELDAAEELPKYKAVLAVSGCEKLADMISLAAHLEEYTFDPAIHSPEDAAKDELIWRLSEEGTKLLFPHVNLHSLGCALLEQSNSQLTDYGQVGRLDGQPIQAMEEQPRQGGMEVMT